MRPCNWESASPRNQQPSLSTCALVMRPCSFMEGADTKVLPPEGGRTRVEEAASLSRRILTSIPQTLLVPATIPHDFRPYARNSACYIRFVPPQPKKKSSA